MKNAKITFVGSILTPASKLAAPVAALVLLAGGSPVQADGDGDDSDFNIPASLQVPASNVLTFAAHGRGVQIYTWNAASAKWVFAAPHAVLFEDDGQVVGIHFAGPTWQNDDGSKIVGSKVASVTVDTNAIPWLLLSAVSVTGPGIFADVTYVQRLHTQGGLAPASPGTVDGQQVLVPYSAEYLFYKPQ